MFHGGHGRDIMWHGTRGRRRKKREGREEAEKGKTIRLFNIAGSNIA